MSGRQKKQRLGLSTADILDVIRDSVLEAISGADGSPQIKKTAGDEVRAATENLKKRFADVSANDFIAGQRGAQSFRWILRSMTSSKIRSQIYL